MTVINHKSISGITSITAPAGSDDLLTVHTNDTTERFRIVDSGAIVTGVATASNFKTGTTNVHSVGVEAAGINVLGADTPIGTGATIYNSGAAVFTGIVSAIGGRIDVDNTGNPFKGTRFNAGTDGAVLFLQHSRSGTIGTKVKLNDNDEIGAVQFRAYRSDNSTITNAASIKAEVNGTPSANGVPADLIFNTGTTSAVATERLRIHSNGAVSIANTRNYYGALNVEKTSTSSTAIDVKASGTDARAISIGDHNTIQGEWCVTNNSDISFGTSTNHHLTFYTNGTSNERLRITSGGNVDINGTPPWSVAGGDYRNLSISGQTTSSSGFLWLGNGAAATNADFDLGRINFCNGATITSQIAGSTQTSANDDGRITLSTKATGGSLTERLRIASDGTLTLKNNSGMMMDIQSSAGTGSAWIEFSDTDGTRKGYFGYGSSSSEKVYWVQQKAASMSMYSNGNDRFEVQSDGQKIVKNGRLNINSTFIDFSGSISAPATAAALFRPADNTLAISTANVERFRVDSTGNIHLRSASTNRIVLGSSGGSVGTLSNNENWIRGSGNMVQLNTAGGDYGFEVLGNQKMKLDTSGNLELRSASQCRVTFGSAGGSGNDTNWIRGDADNLMFNCRTGGAHKWEINGSQKMMVSQNGQLLLGNSSEDQGFATFWRIGSSGGDAGTAGQNAAGDKGVNIRADMGPTHTDLTGIDNYTLALRNGAYAGSGIANPQGTIVKILLNGTTYNGWNAYGAVSLDVQGVSGGRGDLVLSTASGTSSIASRLRIKSAEMDTENSVGLNVYGGAINHTNDAVLYCRKTSNADWTFSAHAAHGSGTDYGMYTRVANGASYALAVYDHTNSSWRFRVSGGGGVFATNTNLQSISDQRLKENIVDANSQWNDIKALRFRNFKWKADSGYADGKTYLGLIAQEVEPISPNLVEINAQTKEDIENGVTDPEYKNVKYSIVWMKAMKALQEAQVRIETLEAKVASLEGS